jgi:hypothetical protein
MRWLKWALSALCLCTGAVLSVSLLVVSGSAFSEKRGVESAAMVQYHEDYGYVQPPQNVTGTPSVVQSPETDYFHWLARVSDAAEDAQEGGSGSVSEGTVAGASAPEEALSIMEPPAPYSQVVDNTSAGWFMARGWDERSGSKGKYYGENYSYVRPSVVGAPARFRVSIPVTDYYTVYARWPALEGNNAETLVGVSTTSGIEWIKVDQRRDGDMWVRLGAFRMATGNDYAVQVSGYKAKGRVVADAVMVVRGTQMEPPEVDMGAHGQVRGNDVVQLARNHIGTPYIHSPPGTCEAHRSEDCSCLTSLVFARFGISVPDNPVSQWSYGRHVAKSNLRPGDLVFFKEAGRSLPITHVGIYSGGGNIIHASSYWGRVVERPMEYVSGYYGAKRLGRN